MSFVDPETDDAVLLDVISVLPAAIRPAALILALVVGADDE